MKVKELLTLKNKVALVTGSTKGIGRGIAETMAEQGASVIITSRHQNDCDRVAKELSDEYGVEAVGISSDVTNLDTISSLVEKSIEKFGKIDILVNNAGTAITKKAETLTEEDWDRVVDINLKGVFFVAREVGKHMIEREEGKIINISSIFGSVGDKMILPYLVSKGGVNQMTRGLAMEWARYNIQVNALAPGYVITPMNEEEMNTEAINKHVMRNTPVRRFATVDDIKGAALLLASKAGNYMTGEILKVDGGWTAK